MNNVKKKIKKTDEGNNHEIKFWKDWLDADSLKKQKMVENLYLVKSFGEIVKLPKTIQKHTFINILNGLFEDLENACYIKYTSKIN